MPEMKERPMQPHFVGLWRVDPPETRDGVLDTAFMFIGDELLWMINHGTEDGELVDAFGVYIYEIDSKDMWVTAVRDLRDLGEEAPYEEWQWDIDRNDNLRFKIEGKWLQLVPTSVEELAKEGWQAKLFQAALRIARIRGDSFIEQPIYPLAATEEAQRLLEEAERAAAAEGAADARETRQ